MAGTGIIILAAGASNRLGIPKQNLLYQGQTLLQHAVQAAMASVAKPVLVVLGAHAELLKPETEQPQIQILVNPEWQEGMASSIRCGISALLQVAPAIDGVILMVCDQPFVSAELLDKLVSEKAQNPEKIITCTYQDTLGTPALFDKQYFPELLNLQGQEGAKKLLFQHADSVYKVDFPQGAIDIDTPQDYEALQQNNFKA